MSVGSVKSLSYLHWLDSSAESWGASYGFRLDTCEAAHSDVQRVGIQMGSSENKDIKCLPHNLRLLIVGNSTGTYNLQVEKPSHQCGRHIRLVPSHQKLEAPMPEILSPRHV